MSLRSVLLVLLSKGPNTGYGVGRLLQHELRHLWEARLQQIYGEFARLQEEGLVDAETVAMPNRPAKKLYSLTPTGEAALDGWLAGPPALHPARDELLIQLSCLDRVPLDLMAHRLAQRRDDSLAQAATLRDLILASPRTDPGQLGHLLTLQASLARAEAEASWCEKALAMLTEEVVATEDALDNAEAAS